MLRILAGKFPYVKHPMGGGKGLKPWNEQKRVGPFAQEKAQMRRECPNPMVAEMCHHFKRFLQANRVTVNLPDVVEF